MKIFVTAKPSARETKVERVTETSFIVSVKEPPVQGKANVAIFKALAEHFKVSTARVRLVSGFTSRQKTFEIS
ncbi:MAG: DUF167 domain-containing protein [bacterium]|nr:DUF167 domain-containing protein [bacterium]